MTGCNELDRKLVDDGVACVALLTVGGKSREGGMNDVPRSCGDIRT